MSVRAFHAETEITLDNLTHAYGNNGELVTDVGWWDADSILDNTGGTGAAWRTNQTGAPLQTQFSGTPFFGIKFTDIYSTTSFGSNPITPYIGRWKFVLRKEYKYGPVVEIKYISGPILTRRHMLFGALDPTLSYHITGQMLTPHDHMGLSIGQDSEREPGLVTGAPTLEIGVFIQIESFWTAAGVAWETINDPLTPLKVTVVGDSNWYGFVKPGTTSPDLITNGAYLLQLAYDGRGTLIACGRRLAEYAAQYTGKRLEINSRSYGFQYIAHLSAGIRFVIENTNPAGIAPGFPANFIDRWNKRTQYVLGTTPTVLGTLEGRNMLAGWTCELLFINFGINEQQLHALGVDEVGGTTLRDNIVTDITAIKASHPGIKIFVIGPHRRDSDVGPTVDSGIRFAEALGAGYLDHENDPDLTFYNPTVLHGQGELDFNDLHIREEEHTAIYEACVPLLEALLDG